MSHQPFVFRGTIESQNLNDFYDDIAAIDEDVTDKHEEVMTATTHQPTVQSGKWWVWDSESGEYVNTGVDATGDNAELTATEYQAGASGTVPPTGAWTETIPTVAQGSFLWTRYTWNNGEITYQTARQGVDGQGNGDMMKADYDSNSAVANAGGIAAYVSSYHDPTKANVSSLAAVATSGDYDDLSNKPTIPTVPTNVSSFVNDAGYLTLSTLPIYNGGVE